ncbi:hypothetical protein C0583_00100 [Candidatus Parcubacteria bacterium]|nr:MAG: hypothetical protein C0583_00100 [Candidatus Parcubacteria bacterium]
MEKLLYTIKKFIPRKVFLALQPAYHYLFNLLAAVVYRFPSKELIVIGITGTTGKTTSVYLIARTLEKCGYKVGFTSTAMFNDGKREWMNNKKMTMLGRFFTQKILRRMVKNGCQYAIVETTSEGVKQFRHKFINYDIAIFTGLYEEHIESHGSFENYKQAKGKFFAHLCKCTSKHVDENKRIIKSDKGMKKIELERVKKTIIANGDDEYAEYFLSFKAEQKLVYSSKSQDEKIKNTEVVNYEVIRSDAKGNIFKLKEGEINLQLLGSFNVKNAMNAFLVAKSQGIKFDKIKNGLEVIKGVDGRLERIDEGQDYTVIVDYAFEPGALSNLYETVKMLSIKKVIHVLGSCGGGRDVSRRPKMGQLAGINADIVIVTNEDPYDDDPRVIIEQVAMGAEKAGKKENKDLFKIDDRREAIKKALELANTGDIVLITGKGSEQAMVVANGEKISWDDRAVVRGILNKK